MMRKIDRGIMWTLFAGLLLLSGCLGAPKADRTQFYQLSSLHSTGTAQGEIAELEGTAIGVGPVRIPAQLDRPQIIILKTPNENRLAEYAEWSEPLEKNFTRVLAENLSILLATDDVAIFPWLKTVRLDYQITVDVTRFSAGPGGKSVLRARWTVYGEQGQTELYNSFSKVSAPVETDNIISIVMAQSLTVETLSREIAEAIQVLSLESRRKTATP